MCASAQMRRSARALFAGGSSRVPSTLARPRRRRGHRRRRICRSTAIASAAPNCSAADAGAGAQRRVGDGAGFEALAELALVMVSPSAYEQRYGLALAPAPGGDCDADAQGRLLRRGGVTAAARRRRWSRQPVSGTGRSGGATFSVRRSRRRSRASSTSLDGVPDLGMFGGADSGMSGRSARVPPGFYLMMSKPQALSRAFAVQMR